MLVLVVRGVAHVTRTLTKSVLPRRCGAAWTRCQGGYVQFYAFLLYAAGGPLNFQQRSSQQHFPIDPKSYLGRTLHRASEMQWITKQVLLCALKFE